MNKTNENERKLYTIFIFYILYVFIICVCSPAGPLVFKMKNIYVY